MTKTNWGLVGYAKSALGLPYWLGTFGQTASEELWQLKHAQYPGTYTDASKPSYQKQYGKAVHDCNGLIKGYFWKDTLDAPYKYESNGLADINEAQMYAMCRERGKISAMPDIPGLLVFLLSGGVPYHVGVYIGGGEVIEARGHDYGVIKSQINVWQEWGKFPLLEYSITDTTTPTDTETLTEAFTAAALADDIVPKWDEKLSDTAKRCLVQKWQDGKYRNTHLTLLAQTLMGMPKSECDGYCGDITTAAIKEFQRKAGLSPDGGIGARTWGKLLGTE